MEICAVHDILFELSRDTQENVKEISEMVSGNKASIAALSAKVDGIGSLVTDIQRRVQNGSGQKPEKGSRTVIIILSILFSGFAALPIGMKILDALLKAFG